MNYNLAYLNDFAIVLGATAINGKYDNSLRIGMWWTKSSDMDRVFSKEILDQDTLKRVNGIITERKIDLNSIFDEAIEKMNNITDGINNIVKIK